MPDLPNFMKSIFHKSFVDNNLQSAVAPALNQRIMQFLNGRYVFICLLIIGIGCSIFSFASYAPADGADANDYYVYAAYIAGIDLPHIAASVKPMVPLFIAINHYLLGNFTLILVWQFIFASVRGVLIFSALKRYHPILAFGSAIVVLFDMQVNYVFTQVATEPLYIFLLIVAFTLVMRAERQQKNAHWWDLILCISLVFLFETRTVAQLLWIPLLTVFAIQIRDMKRIIIAITTFTIIFFSFQIFMHLINATMLVNENDKMFIRPLAQLGLLDETSGEANAQVADRMRECEEQNTSGGNVACLFAEPENIAETNQLLRNSYLEAFLTHSSILIPEIAHSYINYLRMSGLQRIDGPTPADVQCADVEARAVRNTDYYLQNEWKTQTITAAQAYNLQEQIAIFTQQMCPPSPTSDTLRRLFDKLATFYKFLAPSDPKVYYGILLIAVTIIPWMRRYWLPTVTAFGILTYHALISAVLSNVQARYVLVTNPFRAILFAISLFLLAYFLINILDKSMIYFQLRKNSTHS